MILIFSEKKDYSTCEVIDWLIEKNIKYIRINEYDFFETKIYENKILLYFDNKEINIDDIDSIWYRRSLLQLKGIKLNNRGLNSFLDEEKNVLNNYILFLLSKKRTIGSSYRLNVNKLIINDIANEVGLKVPLGFLSNSKLDLDRNKQYITKPINENPYIKLDENHFYSLLTKEVNHSDKTYEFGTSFFQEKINKKYELRVFYLKKNIYTMAIFSQNDSKTSVDFRNYNREKPNRTVPFKLPCQIEDKIKIFMKKINLNCGSIDFLVDNNFNFFFLEVNPVGQFGMVSQPCNYNLEEKIVNFLTKEYL